METKKIGNRSYEIKDLTVKVINTKGRILKYYGFKSLEKLNKYMEDRKDDFKRAEKQKAENKVKRKKLANEELLKYNIGDLLYWSRGWEQTNISYFQITEKKGRKVKIERIGSKIESVESSMNERVLPVRDRFLTDDYAVKENGWKIIGAYGISMEFGCMSKTEDNESHFSFSRA